MTENIETEQKEVAKTEISNQVELAKEVGNAWKFEGNEYELFLVNQQGGASIVIRDSDDNKPLVMVGAYFAWENSQPFMENLDYNWRDEVDLNTNITTPKVDNITTRNAKLFREVLQGGFVAEYDEFGVRGENQLMSRKQLLDLLEPEYQSELINNWLDRFYISRYVDKSQSKIQSILKSDTIIFKVKIGDVEKPKHILLIEFKKPNAEERRNYEDKSSARHQEQEGNTLIKQLFIDNEFKYAFARKFFKSVSGVAVKEIGRAFVENETEILTDFRKGFCPLWWVRLADALNGAYRNTGKS